MKETRMGERQKKLEKYLQENVRDEFTIDEIFSECFGINKEGVNHGMRIHLGRLMSKSGYQRVQRNDGSWMYQSIKVRHAGGNLW